MIKAVIFDMGGVMVNLNLNRCVDSFLALGFEDIRDFLDPCHQRGMFMGMEHGTVSADEFISECLQHSRPGTTPGQVVSAFATFLDGAREDAMRCINSLRGKVDLYVLSNNNPIAAPVCESIIKPYGVDFTQPFKKVFISYEMKMLKPYPEIFGAAVEEIGCEPSEMLFIDDSQRNLDAAAAFGINTLLCSPETDLSVEVPARLHLFND